MNNIIIHNLEEFFNIDLLCDPDLVVVKYNHNHKSQHGESQVMSCTPGKYYIAKRGTNSLKMYTRNSFNKANSSYVTFTDDSRFTKLKIHGYYCPLGQIYPITSFNENTYYCLDITSGSCISVPRTKGLGFVLLRDRFSLEELKTMLYKFLTKNGMSIKHTEKSDIRDQTKKFFIDLETSYPFEELRPKTVALDLVEPAPIQTRITGFGFFETTFEALGMIPYLTLEQNFLNHKCKIPEKSKLTNHLDEQFLLLL